MNVSLTAPQSEFFRCTKKSIAVVAGFGAGKTNGAMVRMLYTMLKYKGANMLYMAPTYPLIRDIWYPKLETFLEELNIKYHIDKREHVVQLHKFGKIFCRTMEKPARLVGFEVLDAYLDELDILPIDKGLEIWRKAKARCRQKTKKQNQVCVTTTPEGFKATYELFKKNPIKNSQLIQMTTYSNQHNLPADYIEELLNSYPPQLIKAYIDGKFVNLTQGTIYYSYDRIKNRSIYTCREGEPLEIGMDFNVGNMSAVIHVERNNKSHAVGEITGVLDTPKMIQTILQKYHNHPITIYPDASGKNRNTTSAHVTDIKLLKSVFEVVVNHANPSVRDRINSMNAMFCNAKGARRYYVNDFQCPNYASCLEEQCYDSNGQPDKKNNLDHLPDGAGYYITKNFGVYRPSIGSNTLRTT